MEAKTCVIERVLKASVHEVWQAITVKELMRQWYFDLPEFKAERGFKFEVTGGEPGGKQYLHHFEITEVEIEKKLTHTWSFVGYEGMSYLTFELVPEGNNTKLILTHSGLETFPADNPDFAFEKFEQGWQGLIDVSLTNFLAKNTMATPIVAATPDCEIMSTRLLHYPRELVFEAFANPDHLKIWWGPNGFTNTFHEFDFRVGGKWSFTMHGSDNDNYPNECEFIQIEKPSLIAWKRYTKPLFQMVLLFEQITESETKFSFQILFESADECKALQAFIAEKNEENFDRLEKELKKMISK